MIYEKIFDFNQFKNYKKINEEATADPRAGSYGGGGDTYFANVKGNFAGAENTLVGSAVMKIFGFFKRKINEGILFVYKKALFREYLANVLRFAAKNNIGYQSESTLFEVRQIKNAEGADEMKEIVKVKFISQNKEKKSLTPYEVGAKVVDEQNKAVVDGTYQNITETSQFVIKNGIIDSINPIELPEPTEETAQKEKEEEKGGEDKEFEENIGDDVKEIADDVNKILKNINNINIEELNEYITKIKAIMENIRLSGVHEIDELLKHKNLPAVHKEELQKDRKVYVEEHNILKKLYKSLLNAKSKKGVDNPVTKPAVAEKTVEPIEVKKEEIEFSEFDDVLNEEFKISKGVAFRGVKLGGVDKKLADEVGNLDLKILEDEGFAKNFEPKNMKDAVTALVVENSQPIQKIQLAAERMYKMGTATSATSKLENTWQRMVKDVLTLFSRYMNTEQVSPFVLVQNAPASIKKEAEIFDDNTRKSAKDSMVDDNTVLKIKKGFDTTKQKVYGILRTQSSYFLYRQWQVTIGKSTYWTYQILATVDWDKFGAVKDASDIFSCITYEKSIVASKLGFANTVESATSPSFSGNYQTAFIINTTPGSHLKTINSSTEPRGNDVNLMALYVKKELINDFKIDDYLKTYFLVFKPKGAVGVKDNKVFRNPKDIKSTEYTLKVFYSWQITDIYADDYKIPDVDIKLNVSNLKNISNINTLRTK